MNKVCLKCGNTAISIEDRVIGYDGKFEVRYGVTWWEKEIKIKSICTSCAIELTKEFSKNKKKNET